MPVTLSIKDLPDELAERLRQRAKRNHRSLQGELLAILEEAEGQRQPLSVDELVRRIEESGFRSPSESAALVREDGDAR